MEILYKFLCVEGSLSGYVRPCGTDLMSFFLHLGREVVFQCRDEGPIRARVKWSRANNLPLPPGSKDLNGRLEMPNIQVWLHQFIMLCTTFQLCSFHLEKPIF